MEILYLFTNDTLTNGAVIERIDNPYCGFFIHLKFKGIWIFLRKKQYYFAYVGYMVDVASFRPNPQNRRPTAATQHAVNL